MVGPEAFMEVRYLAHAKQMHALELIPQLGDEFKKVFGRDSGGLIRSYSIDDAETVVVAMGSILGTIKDVVDEMRADGEKIGVLGITSFRPFPITAIREALKNAKRVVVLEKSLAVGRGGILASDVRKALRKQPVDVFTVIAGLGGRAITKKSLHALFLKLALETEESLTFLDLDWGVVNRQLERERQTRRSGPAAENMLRDIGTVASKIA